MYTYWLQSLLGIVMGAVRSHIISIILLAFQDSDQLAINTFSPGMSLIRVHFYSSSIRVFYCASFNWCKCCNALRNPTLMMMQWFTHNVCVSRNVCDLLIDCSTGYLLLNLESIVYLSIAFTKELLEDVSICIVNDRHENTGWIRISCSHSHQFFGRQSRQQQPTKSAYRHVDAFWVRDV